MDTLSYESSRAGVSVDLETNIVSGGDAIGDTISNFENIIGSNHKDELIGDAHDNDIRGGTGNDMLDDGGGNDRLTGDTGDDTFIISPYGTVVIVDFNSIRERDLLNVGRLGVSFNQIMSATFDNSNGCEIRLTNKKIVLLDKKRPISNRPGFLTWCQIKMGCHLQRF